MKPVLAQRSINKLYESFIATGYDIIPFIKAASEILGRGARWMRQPGMSLDDERYGKVEKAMVELGLI